MKKQHNKGFTLIEVVVSITLLAIIALFMLPMSVQSLRFSKWNNIKLAAMNLAYSQIEYLKAEAAKDYDKLGIDLQGYSPKGIIKEDLYMNELGTNPITIEGIQYKLLTSIYWESARASNGEFVANAMKKADVTVKAKDIFTGIEKTYSVLGTLIAREGERDPANNKPLLVKVITGESFTEPAKNVMIIVNNTSNTLVNWGRTDERGEVFFTELEKPKIYRVCPKEWDKGDMMGRPTGLDDTKKAYIFYDSVEIKDTVNDYIEHTQYVDYPGYIDLQGHSGYPYYSDVILSSKLILRPNYTPPDGVMIDLDLNTNLKELKNLKIWRSWVYDKYSITDGTDTYYFIEKDTYNLWDGRFPYIDGSITKKELLLGYGINQNIGNATCKNIHANKYEIEFEFTSKFKGNPDDIKFSLYNKNNSKLDYAAEKTVIEKINEKRIKITLESITGQVGALGQKAKLYIDNTISEIYRNEFGMPLVTNNAFCELEIIN